jgi:hypothetical protein
VVLTVIGVVSDEVTNYPPRIWKSQIHVYILPELFNDDTQTSLPSTHLLLLLIPSLDLNFYECLARKQQQHPNHGPRRLVLPKLSSRYLYDPIRPSLRSVPTLNLFMLKTSFQSSRNNECGVGDSGEFLDVGYCDGKLFGGCWGVRDYTQGITVPYLEVQTTRAFEEIE